MKDNAQNAVDYPSGCRLLPGNLAVLVGRVLTRSDYNSSTDEQLIAQTLHGEARAYETLVRRYQKLVYNVLYQLMQSHELAADVTQETFIKAFRALPGFRKGAPFKPWLLRIASNTGLNKLRDEKHRRHQSLDALIDDKTMPEPAIEDDPAREVDWHLTQVMLADALSKLPARHRHVFLLRYQHELSYAEICEVIGEPETTIKALLFRTRERLRKMLADEMRAGDGSLSQG